MKNYKRELQDVSEVTRMKIQSIKMPVTAKTQRKMVAYTNTYVSKSEKMRMNALNSQHKAEDETRERAGFIFSNSKTMDNHLERLQGEEKRDKEKSNTKNKERTKLLTQKKCKKD